MGFTMPVSPEFGRLRQMNREFEDTVDYRARLLPPPKKRKEGENEEWKEKLSLEIEDVLSGIC